MAMVLDSSVTIAWALDEDAGPHAREVIRANGRDGMVVPPIWRLEVANTLLQAERRGRHAKADTLRAIDIIEGLKIVVDGDVGQRAFGRVLDLARDTGLTAYDASYLDLAMRTGLPLATLDRRLVDAARGVGVSVL